MSALLFKVSTQILLNVRNVNYNSNVDNNSLIINKFPQNCVS